LCGGFGVPFLKKRGAQIPKGFFGAFPPNFLAYKSLDLEFGEGFKRGFFWPFPRGVEKPAL